MHKSIIIIITGMPGTGKTTIGKALSVKYHFPFISKDAFKERMFDSLGWSDKTWSLKVSAASHRIMDYVLEEELKAGHSVILESNFKQNIDSERFRRIQALYGCGMVQILCWANGEVVFERFMERIESAARHQGHVEEIPVEQIKREFVEANGKDVPLNIEGETVELDTTNVNTINYESVYHAVNRVLSK